jgi:hypothetical protein
MAERENGGPAFPRLGEGFGNERYEAPGMSLRDYFAAKAMQAVFAQNWTSDDHTDSARRAYAMADAMVEQRKK